MPVNMPVHLLVELESGLTLFHLKDGIGQSSYMQQHYLLDHNERDEFEKSIRRFKTFKRAALMKVFAKLFPQAQEVAITQPDYRLLVNGLIDSGSEVLEIYDNGGKPALIHADRTDEHGQHVNIDGIPTQDINCITGLPYPRAPEGMNRYTVSIIYDRGRSYGDVHKMIMAKTGREAVQQELAFLESDDNPMKQHAVAWSIFGGGTILQAIARNKDTEETEFFVGPDLTTNAETKTLGAMFAMFTK